LNTATGEAIGQCHQRHRHQEFLKLLNTINKAYPHQEIHPVMDNYATHKHPAVRKWFDDHPQVTPHFTPNSACWLNMVEIWFGIIDRQAIRRGSFGSVRELTTKIASSSAAGTPARNRSSGPKTPTPSSNPSTVKRLTSHDIRTNPELPG
ncbi:hypothetical protein F0Q45_26790, partial [Mycobacterium simiae]